MYKNYRRFLLALFFAAFVSIAVGACGGADGTAVTNRADGPAIGPPSLEAPAPAAVAVTDLVSPITETVTLTSAVTDTLDADAIVAAYEKVLGDIYTSVLPSVVRIVVAEEIVSGQREPRSNLPQGFERFFDSPDGPDGFINRGEGSGFVWSDDGHIVTNRHVVADADRVTVIFADGTEYTAKVLGSDQDSDLAVLKIEADRLLPAVNLGDSSKLKVGQLAVAIGNPFGQEFTMTRGIVSALGRSIRSGIGRFANPQVIQTDAPINPGNSGGPLLDRYGSVVGITSQLISSSGVNAGVGFAVPINTVKRVIPELIASGKYEYAYMGISGESMRAGLADANGLPNDTRGVLVVQVVEGGPADNAGIVGSANARQLDGVRYPVGGDVITRIDGMPVKGMTDLIAYLAENIRPGDRVRLDLLRDGGDSASLEVILVSRPAPAGRLTG